MNTVDDGMHERQKCNSRNSTGKYVRSNDMSIFKLRLQYLHNAQIFLHFHIHNFIYTCRIWNMKFDESYNITKTNRIRFVCLAYEQTVRFVHFRRISIIRDVPTHLPQRWNTFGHIAHKKNVCALYR